MLRRAPSLFDMSRNPRIKHRGLPPPSNYRLSDAREDAEIKSECEIDMAIYDRQPRKIRDVMKNTGERHPPGSVMSMEDIFGWHA